MRSKALFIIICILGLSSCYTPSYLPKPSELATNAHGGFIKVTQKKGVNIQGELIAIDSMSMLVLTDTVEFDDSLQTIRIPFSNISQFKMRYANNNKRAWTIPIFTIVTISHGYGFILTAPINTGVTTTINRLANEEYLLKSKFYTYKDLVKYSRFPQGIPAHIRIEDIR